MLTQEQKRLRKGHITSSMAAGALGLSPSMSPLQAWAAATGRAPDLDGKAIERGNTLEPVILRWLADSLGRRLGGIDTVVTSWTADSADGVLYAQDGSINYDMAEVKSRAQGMAGHYGDEDTDQIYPGDLVQCYWHLVHHPSAERCWVGVLVGGYDFSFRRYVVPRNDELQDLLRARLRKWYDRYVVTDIMPPADYRDLDLLPHLQGAKTGGDIELDISAGEMVCQYKEAAAAEKEAKQRKDGARAQLAQLLGEHTCGTGEWGKVRYRTERAGWKTDWESVAKALGAGGELIQEHTHQIRGSRVLRVYPKKGK